MDKQNDYFKTDDLQWCRKKNTCCFDFVEVRNQSPETYIYVAGTIDLYDYEEKDILSCISGYGYKSEEDLKKEYHSEWTQVEAECLFEQTSDDELMAFGPFQSIDEAEKAAENYIANQK